MGCVLDLRGLAEKEIHPLGENFRGVSSRGEELSLTNYYLTKGGRPFFGVSGELHFSRMSPDRWEDELLKMKMGGVNVVSTYVFWIHHEEEEGIFRFDGRRDLRRFVELCGRHGLYVILRIGPFCHGEVRNGGLPDWLYGKPFECRSLDEGFLFCTKRLYSQTAAQVEGLFFRDGGPIIALQLDNEYMHSSAPWEMTTGISNEWLSPGRDGDAYLLRLKELAEECGLTSPFYTCTAWGGAAAPESMVPLWGGYAFRPWIFYSHQGEHPATEEYVYQDYHRDGVVCTDDFKPRYRPESRPYFCCEMGGGMMCSYYYRFQLPCASVDAMANIKLGSGCNFLGYYMFHGGSNPLGAHGLFLNEGQVPKISYDYQAALGEFGQVRESYRRLKSIHYFVQEFGERLCPLQTVLPEGASQIVPRDAEALRWAVRTDGRRGFLFLNNYQDHFPLPDRQGDEIALRLGGETLTWNLGIAGGENAILPFHFDMDGIDLVRANAQLITKAARGGETTYVFFVPDGMRGQFIFGEGARINGAEENVYTCAGDLRTELFRVEQGGVRRHVLVLDRELSNNMFRLSQGRLAFTDAVLLEDAGGIRLESGRPANLVHVYPADGFDGMKNMKRAPMQLAAHLGTYSLETEPRRTEALVRQVGPFRFSVRVPETALEGVKDVRLQIRYAGDIGYAFLNGRLISDNFANGAVWEIGLREFADELKNNITLYLAPRREGARVSVESSMAARTEEADVCISELKGVELQPVYEIRLG